MVLATRVEDEALSMSTITQQPTPIGPMPRVVRLDDSGEWTALIVVAVIAIFVLAMAIRRVAK